MKKKKLLTTILFYCVSAYASAADLYIGAASVDITPNRPVLLQGQHNNNSFKK